MQTQLELAFKTCDILDFRNAKFFSACCRSMLFQALTLESLKIVQEKYGDKEGQEKTERDLERLCAEYNICLDDLSEQRTDDKCDAEEEEEEDSASGQEEDGADDLDTSDSGVLFIVFIVFLCRPVFLSY